MAMIGALAVAEDLPAAQTLSSLSINSGLFLPILLIIITLALVIFRSRTAFSPSRSSLSTQSSFLSESQHLLVINQSKPVAVISRITTLLFKSLRYLIIAILAIALMIGSILQALNRYQHLEITKITQSSRVQAWVTIEGISDSVYNATNNSGYRQVVTLSNVQPLVAELSVKDLDQQAAAYSEFNSDTNTDNHTDTNSKNPRVLLSLYPKKSNDKLKLESLNTLQPGDKLLMTLTLAPLASSQQAVNNPSGFDSYRWLRARHIDGVATIITVSSVVATSDNIGNANTDSQSYWQRWRQTIDQWRWQLRQHFYQDWETKATAEQQASAVTLSLLTGDRSLITRDTKDLYQLAGISHLLAISGTHVLFMAIMLAALATKLIQRFYPALYRTLPRWQARWWVMLGSAFMYALFTGFDVPAARTAWMLFALGLVRLTLQPISTMRVLLALAIVMAWLDPYVLWQAGFWLSFIAVALLLKYDESLQHPPHPEELVETSRAVRLLSADQNSRLKQGLFKASFYNTNVFYSKVWPLFKRVFRLQCWLFIALLPVTLLLFGKVSLWGLIINLFAIGLFGWVIVPLNLLAALCYLISPTLADKIWTVVNTIVGSLHQLIDGLTTLPLLQGAWLYTPITTIMLLMATLIILPWLLPRGLLSRWLALPPSALLIMTLYANQQAFSVTPTLYILPTGDAHITAAVLKYPIDKFVSDKTVGTKSNANKKSADKRSVSWLFLADHRPKGESDRSNKPSSLTADKLSSLLEQQLRTLSITHLQGIVVQTATPTLTDALSNPLKTTGSKTTKNSANASALLPTTIAQLNSRFPSDQYWQAGRHERWSGHQQASLTTTKKALISAQDCQQDQMWQSVGRELKLQAITGWSEIKDSSVWDCSIAITSQTPIAVVHYNAKNPQQPLSAIAQILTTKKSQPLAASSSSSKPTSTLIVDAATHARSWQLWSLLCEAEPLAVKLNHSGPTNTDLVTWLSHSSSKVSAETLQRQQVNQVFTYDQQPLDVALLLTREP